MGCRSTMLHGTVRNARASTPRGSIGAVKSTQGMARLMWGGIESGPVRSFSVEVPECFPPDSGSSGLLREGLSCGRPGTRVSWRATDSGPSQRWRPRDHLATRRGFLPRLARPTEVVVLHPLLTSGIGVRVRWHECGAWPRDRLVTTRRLTIAERSRTRLKPATGIRPIGDHVVHSGVDYPRSAQPLGVGEPRVHRWCATERRDPQRKRSHR